MNSLDRSLIEKAGYDHGWEVPIPGLLPSEVELASSRHRGRVVIRSNGSGWLLDFNETINLTELRRSFPASNFQGGEVTVPDRSILGALLARAALLGEHLPSQPLHSFHSRLKEYLVENPSTAGTEKEVIVRQRIGQGLYREALMGYWNGCCAVTGIDVPEVLRASHAKPWAVCESDGERLDVFNGVLLSANLDALFDRGLVTFDAKGLLVTSPAIPKHAARVLGIDGQTGLRWIAEEHLPYLMWHRDRVFRK